MDSMAHDARRQADALESIAKTLDRLVAEIRAWRSMSSDRSAALEASLAPTIAELARLDDVHSAGSDEL
jgi:hypothetical protein